MTMENQVEDIYLKGMMAYSAKDYQKANGYWSKVLEINPDHPGAKKGLMQLNQMKKKRTPKEVLREIKELYASKDFEKALKLCEMLVNKFPQNQDLQGLKKKIELRFRKSQIQNIPLPGPSPTGLSTEDLLQSAEESNLESTMYYQKKAEDATYESPGYNLDATAENEESVSEVDRLIQQGVTLYEIQDFEQALVVWNKVIELEPGNKVVSDYIAGVRELLGQSEASPVKKTTPDSPPGKEELISIYNQGKELYKEKNYREALEKWQSILAFYPNHKETLLCVKRAEKGISEDNENLAVLAEAEAAYSAGNYSDAERLILPLLIKAPHLEGPKKLKKAIEEMKQQITQIKDLEMESHFSEATAIATDDEITQYFTPTSDLSTYKSSTVTPKMVISATEIMAQEKSTRKKIFMGLGLTAILLMAAGGFFVWQNWSEMRKKIIADAPVKVTIPRTIKWYSNEARVNDYLEIAREFKNLGDYFMAYCAYDKIIQLSDGAVTELIEQKDALEALEKIRQAKATAIEEKENAKKKIVPETVDKAGFEKVLKGWKPEDAATVIPILQAALTQNYDDLELREYLAKAKGQLGFQLANNLTTLEQALDAFKRASILGSKDNRYRGHYKVIQLFYTNTIDDHERKQWFFLFSGS